MPSFLSNLRRKGSRSSKMSARHSQMFADGQDAKGLSHRVSASTLNSSQVGSSTQSTTPATSTNEEPLPTQTNGHTNGPTPAPQQPQRPQRPTVDPVKRYSTNVGRIILDLRTLNNSRQGSLASPTSHASNTSLNRSSVLAPRILSINEGSWVHQQVLLVFGHAGDPDRKPLDGTVTVHHHQGRFPPTAWPVHDSCFKALIHLEPGWNRIRIEFTSPKVSSSNSSISPHTSYMNLNYLPPSHNPPLQLAIILGRDSQGTYDAPPERMQREGNGLDLAIRKFRMSAYLWQAFTGEQMYRHNHGRRCFRFEDSWEPGTLSYQDWGTNQLRTQAKVHIIRSNRTVAEIRALERAQQYNGAGEEKKAELFDIAADACQDYFNPTAGQKIYVSCLFIDSTWDTKEQTIRGHAALGGGRGDIQLAIFGSHALHSYPSSLEEVVQALSDCTRTNTEFVANDCNESGSNWECANIGIGAHLHETGHLFGCPHQESGVMLRDYVTLNRTFVCREPYSTRTKSPGQRLVLDKDECKWHPLDALRFRFHPCFRIPTDPVTNSEEDGSVQVWTVDSGSGGVLATSRSGIAWAELRLENDELCHKWLGFQEANGRYPTQVELDEKHLRAQLPKDQQRMRMKVEIFSAGGGHHVVEDYNVLANQKLARVKLPDGRFGFRGSKLGFSQMQGSEPHEIILESAHMTTKLLLTIRVWSGLAADGLEFIYEDSTSQLFGKRGGHSTDFHLDTRKGERLIGFNLRAGLWIDGIQILTSLGRRSDWFGNATGGSGHTLIPPRGYTIGGISGSSAAWLDGFALIITR